MQVFWRKKQIYLSFYVETLAIRTNVRM